MTARRKSEMPRWRRYLRFWGPDAAADVDEEFRFHVEERIEELIARGLDARSAREEVMRGFGDIEQVKWACQVLALEKETAMRRSEWLDALTQDVVLSFRQMRSNLSLTAAAMLTVALGIGGTTAIFSVVNAVLLRPLPYQDAERVVYIWETFREFDGRASVGHFHDWTEQTGVFEATAAWQARTYNLTNDGDPMRIVGARVTPRWFEVSFMTPEIGRYFQPDELNARVVVLSHGLWQERYGGDRSIVGRDIILNGEAHTVIGVTPAAYTLSEFEERLWTPFPLVFAPAERHNYGSHGLLVLGKLKPGITLERAQAELHRVTEGIRARQPDAMTARGVRAETMRAALIGNWQTQLYVLLGAVSFVLLIACGNVASLLLARATTRRKEIAIRGALGGGRGRLIRQLLTESLVLAVAGGAAGMLVASLGIRFLVGMGPSGVPRLQEAALDANVLGFALAATLLSGLIFGLAPALRATRTDLQSVLREGGKTSRGSARDRLRGVLVVTEIAVALVLLVSAGLFIRSALIVNRIPLGFTADDVTMLRIALPQDRYSEIAVVNQTFARMLERLRAVPGVERVAFSTRVPLWGPSIDIGLTVQGKTFEDGQSPIAHVRLNSAEFLQTLQIPLKRGRLLTESDLGAGAPSVVVINETLARSAFGDANPIGQRVYGWTSRENPEWREIVGVVGDVRAFGREADTPPEIFIPHTKAPGEAWTAFQRSVTFVVKGRGAVTPLALRQAIAAVDPQLPLYDVQTMNEVLAQSTAVRRFNTMLLALLGMTGLVLSAIGVYGVIAFFVTQRRHEIGVRLALGATTRNVVGLVLGQGALLTGLGVLLGGGAAFAATRVLDSLLFQVQPLDPVTYAACAALLAIVALCATLIPARRAARVHPVESLNAS
ncbi:MAG: ABC transporter permease [Gemmatimonadota bacterium]